MQITDARWANYQKVVNRCTNMLTNEKKEAIGRAYAVEILQIVN